MNNLIAGIFSKALLWHLHFEVMIQCLRVWPNTLAAYRARANFASVTVTGVGERAGNASLEETAVSLKHFYGYDCGIELEALPFLVGTVSKASERTLFPYKPIVGSMACNVF